MVERQLPSTDRPRSFTKTVLYLQVLWENLLAQPLPDLKAKIIIEEQISNKEYWQSLSDSSSAVAVLDLILGYPEFLANNRYITTSTFSSYDPYKAQEQVRMNEAVQNLKDELSAVSNRKTRVLTRLYNPWDIFNNR